MRIKIKKKKKLWSLLEEMCKTNNFFFKNAKLLMPNASSVKPTQMIRMVHYSLLIHFCTIKIISD